MKSLSATAALLALLLVLGAAPASATDYRDGNYGNFTHWLFTQWKKHKYPNGGPVSPVPEPSALLVFGVGLLVAAPLLRRRR
jgi:hypothetical protein